MNWKVKKGIRQHSLSGIGQESVCFIRRTKGQYIIINQKKQTVYLITEVSPLTMKIQGIDEGIAEITLSTQQCFTRPPRAERLLLAWGNASIVIEQSEKRVYTVQRNGEEIGKVIDILSPTVSVYMEDTMPSELVALIYALTLRMLHEDDIEIV